jgi:hypothetical protein
MDDDDFIIRYSCGQYLLKDTTKQVRANPSWVSDNNNNEKKLHVQLQKLVKKQTVHDTKTLGRLHEFQRKNKSMNVTVKKREKKYFYLN